MKFTPVAAAFIVAELLDIATTLLGIVALPKLWEANPLVIRFGGWAPALLVKFCVTLLVAGVLHGLNRQQWEGRVQEVSCGLLRALWIIPFVAGLPVAWNLLVILLELKRYI